jgi:hypothetical protein
LVRIFEVDGQELRVPGFGYLGGEDGRLAGLSIHWLSAAAFIPPPKPMF